MGVSWLVRAEIPAVVSVLYYLTRGSVPFYGRLHVSTVLIAGLGWLIVVGLTFRSAYISSGPCVDGTVPGGLMLGFCKGVHRHNRRGWWFRADDHIRPPVEVQQSNRGKGLF